MWAPGRDHPKPCPNCTEAGFLRIFLGINPLRFTSPAPAKRGVLSTHPCPAVSRPSPVTPCSFPESGRAFDPPRQWQHSGRGLEPSDSRESSSQETQEMRAAHDTTALTSAAAGPRPAAAPSQRSAGGAAGAAARVGAAPVSSGERPADPRSDPLLAGLPPPPRGGAQAGGGAQGGRGAISSLAQGFASTSLGAFPAREPDRVAL